MRSIPWCSYILHNRLLILFSVAVIILLVIAIYSVLNYADFYSTTYNYKDVPNVSDLAKRGFSLEKITSSGSRTIYVLRGKTNKDTFASTYLTSSEVSASPEISPHTILKISTESYVDQKSRFFHLSGIVLYEREVPKFSLTKVSVARGWYFHNDYTYLDMPASPECKSDKVNITGCTADKIRKRLVLVNVNLLPTGGELGAPAIDKPLLLEFKAKGAALNMTVKIDIDTLKALRETAERS